jgi:MFS family permease
LTAGRLADLYGRRRVFLIGSCLYLVFTILCGASQNGIMLFVFRALQGMSSALSVPGAVGIVGATYHGYNKRKAIAFAVIGGMATTGFLAGILLGGICAQLLSWRWLFYISAIIAGIMITSAVLVVPKMAGEEEGKPEIKQKWKEIDWWGQFLSISGLVLLAFSLTYVLRYSSTYKRYSSEAAEGWATWYIIFLLILSLVLLGLFIWVEHKRGLRAMMPLKIWKYPQFGLIMFLLFFGWFDFEIVTLYMTFLYIHLKLYANTSDFKIFAMSPPFCVHCTFFQMLFLGFVQL